MTNIFQVAIVIERNFFSVCSFHLILQFRDCYRALQKKFMLLTSLRHSLCSFLSKITVETIYNHVSWASFPESYNFAQENQSTEEQGRESHKASPGISGPCACIVWLLGPSPLPWSAPWLRPLCLPLDSEHLVKGLTSWGARESQLFQLHLLAFHVGCEMLSKIPTRDSNQLSFKRGKCIKNKLL